MKLVVCAAGILSAASLQWWLLSGTGVRTVFVLDFFLLLGCLVFIACVRRYRTERDILFGYALIQRTVSKACADITDAGSLRQLPYLVQNRVLKDIPDKDYADTVLNSIHPVLVKYVEQMVLLYPYTHTYSDPFRIRELVLDCQDEFTRSVRS